VGVGCRKVRLYIGVVVSSDLLLAAVRRVLFSIGYGSQRLDSDIERVRHSQHVHVV